MQTRAILEAALELAKEGKKLKPKIMIPLVGHVNELKEVRRQLEAVAKEITAQDGAAVDYKFGTMIELPRAALTAGQIAPVAEFFSFGTNDLTQTTFGFSRDDAEGKFLVQKTAITIVPSASVWLLLLVRSKAAIRNVVAFGNPLLNRPDLPSRRAAESEVKRISEELTITGPDPKHVYVREEATEERLQREAPGANLLHIATHGEFPDENARDRHGIMLGQGKPEDGVVRASTIRKLNGG